MGGKGFIRDFEMAIRTYSKENGFITPLGEKMIQDNVDVLSYLFHFNKYKTPDGYTITVIHNAYFDKGTDAEDAKIQDIIACLPACACFSTPKKKKKKKKKKKANEAVNLIMPEPKKMGTVD